eukprot:TRINITY_DN12247_c0_g1_i2.p1 TRINITY_DN12247_c0_g1~~TRINITY_DN12247_c0_g1_i2.p1  ORF type:complete len:622 (+),score=124.27 TRINITY_DN12247_c0_g1_i2:224-2089(+)
MDGSDVSLAIRRARRSNAKSIDLSCRGLTNWPEDLFALRQLETLDISGNYLSTVDPNIAQLELLQEIDLSGNKLESFPDGSVAPLISLRSLKLSGNPMASRMSTSSLQSLARPSPQRGQSCCQMICEVLREASGSSFSSSRVAAPPPPPAEARSSSLVESFTPFAQVDEVTAVTDCGPDPAPRPPPPPPADLDRILAGGGDSSSTWRKEQKGYLAEIERLQARVSELEGQLGDSGGVSSGGGGSGSSGLPSWLSKETKSSSLARTLPSRGGLGMDGDDEVKALKAQLQEEQRKSKRLETQVQRLTDRLKEADMSSSGTGSLPHFEMNEVEVGEILNQGGFSTVHKGFYHGTKVAVKKLFDPNISAELLAEFDNEVDKLEKIRHPNILMALALHRKPPALSLVMELVEGGSYYQLLHYPAQFNAASGPVASGGLPLKETLEILEVAGMAIAFLHGRGIAHRDVKTQNVLLSPHLEVKLCDFGLARMRSELMTGTMQFAGTPNYMAPEIFQQMKYNESVDVFAFGTMLWEAMTVEIPWANWDPGDIRERVCSGQFLQIPTSVPPMIQQLIQGCWRDAKVRLPMPEVLSQLRECKDGGRARRPRTAGPSVGGAPRPPPPPPGGF